MKRSDVFPQKYTKADDLQNREITVTIDRVSLEEVGPEKEQKPVLYFVEDGIKPIVVNGTNWDRLEHAFGIGKPPKRAILLRADEPFPKIVGNVIAPSGAEEKIELLADGQQLVAFGIHSETRQPYRWHGGEPGPITRENLPYVCQRDAQQFIDAAVDLLVREYGYTRPPQRPSKKTSGNGHNNTGGADDWAWLIANIRDGRQLHDSLRDLAAKAVKSGMAAGAVVNFLRALMHSSTAPRDDRWQDRYDSIPRLVDGAGQFQPDKAPLTFANIHTWANREPPAREWLIPDRFPLRNVSLLSGEGAVGKSILLMQLAGAIVLGKDWLYTLPEPGPVIYLNAEDDEDELHRRSLDICRHYDARLTDTHGHLHILSLAGQDAVLGYPDRAGQIQPTALFARLKEAACDIRPRMIALDTTADIFGGNEIDRGQVRQFIGLNRQLAIAANAGVVLCTHPSLTGVNNGSGLSGSTAWHNSVRARMYLKPAAAEEGDDPDLRRLEYRKNNYGPLADCVLVRWKNGVYIPEPSAGSLERAASEAKTDNLFLDILSRFNREDRNTSDTKGPTYAPALFADEPEARAAKKGKKDLAEAMRRLFAANRIHRECYSRHRKDHWRLAVGAKP